MCSDFALTTVIALLSIIWVKLITYLANNGPPATLSPAVSRKVIHTTSAPLFLLLLPLYSPHPSARIFATIVPLLNVLRLISAGRSTPADMDNKSDSSRRNFVNAISRSGDPTEALAGPLIYAIVLTALLSTIWTTSLVGVVAISQMAVGDGFADIVGRKFGSNFKWPFSKDKSVPGTLAFISGSTLFTFFLTKYLHLTGTIANPFDGSDVSLFFRLFLVSIGCASIELIDSEFVDDNYSVPLTGVALGFLLLFPS